MWVCYLIKEWVISSSNSSPMGLSIYVHLYYWFDVVTRKLPTLDDPNTNLCIAWKQRGKEAALTRNKNIWGVLFSVPKENNLSAIVFTDTKPAQGRPCSQLRDNCVALLSLYIGADKTCCHSQSSPTFCRNQNTDNTWKSWGLLARALCLLRLTRIWLWLGFLGWFNGEGAPWPPAVPSVSTSSSPSLTSQQWFQCFSVRRTHLFPFFWICIGL